MIFVISFLSRHNGIFFGGDLISLINLRRNNVNITMSEICTNVTLNNFIKAD